MEIFLIYIFTLIFAFSTLGYGFLTSKFLKIKFSKKNIYNDQIRRNLSTNTINYSKVSRKLVENLTNKAGSAPNKISNELK